MENVHAAKFMVNMVWAWNWLFFFFFFFMVLSSSPGDLLCQVGSALFQKGLVSVLKCLKMFGVLKGKTSRSKGTLESWNEENKKIVSSEAYF